MAVVQHFKRNNQDIRLSFTLFFSVKEIYSFLGLSWTGWEGYKCGGREL